MFNIFNSYKLWSAILPITNNYKQYCNQFIVVSYQCKFFTVVRVKALIKAVRLSRNPPQHGPEVNTQTHTRPSEDQLATQELTADPVTI